MSFFLAVSAVEGERAVPTAMEKIAIFHGARNTFAELKEFSSSSDKSGLLHPLWSEFTIAEW